MFQDVKSGTKNFEYRKNDRDFQVGDALILKEFNPAIQMYSGDTITVKITYLLQGIAAIRVGVPEGFCIMGISPNQKIHEDSQARL